MRKWQCAAGLCFLAASVALAADNQAKQWIHVTKTDLADFAPGGTIHVNSSHGDLNIEAWDRPEVELTVTKSTVGLYAAKDADEARKRLDLIAVHLERKSAAELTIATNFPARTLKRLCRGKSDIILRYQIHVPRDSQLIIRHDTGTVLVSGVAGDVEARSRTGDIVLVLPGSEGYSIDAKVQFGAIDSDFGGASSRKRMVGHRLAFAPSAPKHKLFLRMGVGSISVETLPGQLRTAPDGLGK